MTNIEYVNIINKYNTVYTQNIYSMYYIYTHTAQNYYTNTQHIYKCIHNQLITNINKR